MRFQYGLDDSPPLLKTLLFGFQWAALLVSTILILGKVVGIIHYPDIYRQILYLRKLFFISAITLLFQIFRGHRLPLLPGPSAVLLIGVIASRAFDVSTIYSSIIVGGIIIVVFSLSGFLKYINRLFTSNVVSVVLILIAFTIAPTIMDLMIDKNSGIAPSHNMSFALVSVFLMFLFHRLFKGVLKSTLIIWAIVLGSVIYYFIFPVDSPSLNFNDPGVNLFFSELNLKPVFHPGVTVSFIFCFIALLINDLGSIESVNEVLEVKERQDRVKRGITVTGFANIASGFLGVIGPVNYSISPGIILSTGCASRYTLIPTALILLVLSFLPLVTGIISNIPSVIIGSVLAYVMASQIAAGLIVAFKDTPKDGFPMESGMVIGISIFLGTIVAFFPQSMVESIPLYLRPVLTNGFVAGVVSAVLMEQVLIRKKAGEKVVIKGQ
jgi:xanthine/uracil permease